jgi:hypothetical protein
MTEKEPNVYTLSLSEADFVCVALERYAQQVENMFNEGDRPLAHAARVLRDSIQAHRDAATSKDAVKRIAAFVSQMQSLQR